ncbi:PD-(D/E)XK nuclease family protein [Oscillatoria sp. FACHB-1407]|uniref:PD-(D/E)XK nuclease family protein n=1 Tax=Oscillatoria sp. FACHB-1407 TaxID=2692847 RepID=UPI0016871193|nr:PD-(D/E)XK nuclease family protein [Oscillatoria sp. FACHB-1407]MBD2465006.1 PD-(D/E)XK nuclease family protein [Oscillatoria sp. FACHB-1407]
MVIRLSQGQLSLLEICPRKFQHSYLDQLGSLTPVEQQERLIWGQQFHRLMQQHELGLPLTVSSDEAAPLKNHVEALVKAAPEIFHTPNVLLRQSEHRRTVEFAGYLLTVVYDLLILEDRRAQILDWKTYPRPTQSRSLERNWQTRLYPFVLAETTDYRPEDISITYWFVQGRAEDGEAAQPQHLTFRYSPTQHQRDRQDIARLLGQLTQWRLAEEPFPQVDPSQGYCTSCPFAIRCRRSGYEQNDGISLTLAEIQEVTL